MLGPIRQVGYVVPDLTAAARHWIDQHGAGPFFDVGEITFDNWHYLGAPQQLTLNIAFGQLGDVMIELIRPASTIDSVYRHAMSDRPVLHHLGFLVADIDAAAEAAGFGDPVTGAISAAGAELRYYDTRATNGVMTELLTDAGDIGATFDLARDAAAQWDGGDPFRRFPLPV